MEHLRQPQFPMAFLDLGSQFKRGWGTGLTWTVISLYRPGQYATKVLAESENGTLRVFDCGYCHLLKG